MTFDPKDFAEIWSERVLAHLYHGGWRETPDGLRCRADDELVVPSPRWMLGDAIDRQTPGAWFGEPWPSGICETGPRVETPVGERCFDCGTPIEADHQGSFIYADDTRTLPRHKECSLRSVVGGIGHLEDHERWCVMAGDPDGGRSYRQSALEVWDWIVCRGLPGL